MTPYRRAELDRRRELKTRLEGRGRVRPEVRSSKVECPGCGRELAVPPGAHVTAARCSDCIAGRRPR